MRHAPVGCGALRGVRRLTISDDLAREVLRAIGATAPSDRASLDDLYSRFCATVPFDPVMKALAMREGVTPPGDDPTETAERFLTTGLGGTCWSNCGLLCALLEHAGIDASIGIERMLDRDGVDFHCFVNAWCDSSPMFLDPIHVSGRPMPMRAGVTGSHPAYLNRLESEPPPANRMLHVWRGPENAGRYVVLAAGLDADDVAAFCAVSVQHTGVRARRLFHRTATDREVRIVKPTADGNGLEVRTWYAPRSGGDADAHESGLAFDVEIVQEPPLVMAALGVTTEGMNLVVRAGLAQPSGDGWRFTC